MKNITRMFTIEEANALVPELENILCRLMEKKEKHERLHDDLFMHELLANAVKDTLPELDQQAKDLDEAVANLRIETDRIRQLGCILRSVERGWVDFPSQREGKQIYFCWKKGEKAVQYYHFESNLTERLPL